MDNKNLLIIVSIAVIVIVAVAAVAITLQDDDTEETEGGAVGSAQVIKPTSRLWVFGNANNDDYLDRSDLDMIRQIANGSLKWDSETNPYADTNADGVVNNDDVELLASILEGEECLMYYTQYWAGEYSTSYIHYPADGDIGLNYYQAADITTLLGIWDRVTAAESVVTMSYTYKYPGVGNLYPLGALSSMSTEAVIASGIDVFIAYVNTDATSRQIQQDLRAMGSEIDVIALPIQGADCISAVITMGVLLGCEEASQKYVDYCDRIVDYVEGAVSTLSESEYAEYYIVYGPTDPGNIRIQSANPTNGRITGDLSYILKIPGVNLMPYGESNWYSYRTAEWFIEQDPQYILISMSSTNSGITAQAAQKKFEGFAELFRGTSAYEEGRVIGFSFAVTSTYSGCAPLALIANEFYPDLIDETVAWAFLQEWYDEFTNEDVDVHEVGGAVYRLN